MPPENDPSGKIRRAHHARNRHRARSHEAVHADGGAPSPGAVPDHPLIPRGAALLITGTPALQELIGHLREAGRFAFDSEFIGELSYTPKLCLIQVATSQRVALIDPLAGLDLAEFWDLMCDPAVEKVVHAGQQDIGPVLRHAGKPPANILDTQIAAGFCGMAYPTALSKLVAELTGVKLGKGLTLTHWDQRPLSPMQLRYAADDVRYLPVLREELGQRLKSLGHESFVQEECDAMCHPDLHEFNPDVQVTRVRGATSLPPKGLAVLRELVIWRDAAAQAEDVPPRAYLKDEILVDMARSPVTSVERLDRVRGLPRPVESQHGAAIVAATLRGLAVKAEHLPPVQKIEQTPSERFRTDALWTSVQSICAGRSIDPNLVTNRQEMTALDQHLFNGGGNGPDLPLFKGWRHDAIGQTLLALVRGAAELRLHWREESLRSSVQSRSEDR